MISRTTAGHIGGPEVATGVPVREALVVNPEPVQDRRVEIVDVDWVLRRAVCESAVCEQRGEGGVTMIAPGIFSSSHANAQRLPAMPAYRDAEMPALMMKPVAGGDFSPVAMPSAKSCQNFSSRADESMQPPDVLPRRWSAKLPL